MALPNVITSPHTNTGSVLCEICGKVMKSWRDSTTWPLFKLKYANTPIRIVLPQFAATPTCRAHYPGGSNGCACRLLPSSCSLPQMAGWSASALSHSRSAQASPALRLIGSLSRQSDLCHEAPTPPVTRPSRSSPNRSIDNSLGGIFLH